MSRQNNLNAQRRKHFKKAFQRIKNRVSIALFVFMNTNFEIRQKYRIRYALFETLNLKLTDFVHTATSSNINSFKSSLIKESKLTAVNLSSNTRFVNINIRFAFEIIRSISSALPPHKPY